MPIACTRCHAEKGCHHLCAISAGKEYGVEDVAPICPECLKQQIQPVQMGPMHSSGPRGGRSGGEHAEVSHSATHSNISMHTSTH